MADVNLGTLAQAIPDEVTSFGPGQASILLVSVPEFKTGGTKLSVIQPLIGGAGGRPDENGIDGRTPAGAGRYRGGMGVALEFLTSSPYAVVTSRAMDRYLFQPPGRLGGAPGATSYTTLNRDALRPENIGKVDVLQLGPGDVLRIGTQGRRRLRRSA